MTNDADVYNAIRDQVRHAHKLYPDTKTIIETAKLLIDRAQTCLSATLSTTDDDNRPRTARLAIQVAAVAIRMLQDHDLPLPEAHETST